MELEYGKAPVDLGSFPLKPDEMMFYLYLPVKMSFFLDIRLPKRLKYLESVLYAALEDADKIVDVDRKYVYITAKTLYVEGNFSGNRPGWHADGYGSGGDLNYIWYNMNPTEFAIQSFTDIPTDDKKSMEEMERQVDLSKVVTYPNESLLRLDESVVHRVNPQIDSGVRTFIKISVSSHQFNLSGNSKNYLFDYGWRMGDRSVVRNLDSNKDFI